jgi:tRNA-specific 2-thiouridylase
MKKRILVAMSGGVDSAVTAFLLKEEGNEVIGVTMQLLPKNIDTTRSNACCGIEGIEDAGHVASLLNIRHYVLNMREQFQEYVINDFLDEYKAGRTPNPCIRCNRFLKFGLLMRKAEDVGADYVATGHYARIERDPKSGSFTLKRGIDRKKDQSYFLYVMSQGQLNRTLMPLGNYTKSSVREIAKKAGLPVSSKPGSQEICFIKGKNYRSFFSDIEPLQKNPGPIIDKDGNTLGTHKGIMNYTIGQRRGLGISSTTPLYVNKIDRARNTIVAGPKKEAYHQELSADNVNWIAEPAKKPLKVDAQIRSLHAGAPATLNPADTDRVKIVFDHPQWAITPGQAVVFYSEQSVLGGGIIYHGS